MQPITDAYVEERTFYDPRTRRYTFTYQWHGVWWASDGLREIPTRDAGHAAGLAEAWARLGHYPLPERRPALVLVSKAPTDAQTLRGEVMT